MNKNAIQKFAVWARNELIEQVKQRAYQYGIRENNYDEAHNVIIAGRVLTNLEAHQQHDFVKLISQTGYQQAVEEVAYTWFNRFIALRFMEVNDYLPTHIRVFSDANGGFNPEILKDVLHLDLEGLDKVKVSELLNANQTEELYRYLLLTQCNALNAGLPEVFERLGGYTEMLLPNTDFHGIEPTLNKPGKALSVKAKKAHRFNENRMSKRMITFDYLGLQNEVFRVLFKC